MRPVYHRDDGRARGHILVAALAFLLQQALERKLEAAGSYLSGEGTVARRIGGGVEGLVCF